jgi:hypothetical protein
MLSGNLLISRIYPCLLAQDSQHIYQLFLIELAVEIVMGAMPDFRARLYFNHRKAGVRKKTYREIRPPLASCGTLVEHK